MVSKQEEANMADTVQKCFSLGICRILAPKRNFVDFNDQNRGEYILFLHLVGHWLVISVFFSKFCPRLSVLSWILWYRGVVNLLWFSPRSSNRPVLLCRASQEAVLWRSGHILVPNILHFCQEMFKVDWVIIGEFEVCQPSEVVFQSKYWWFASVLTHTKCWKTSCWFSSWSQ